MKTKFQVLSWDNDEQMLAIDWVLAETRKEAGEIVAKVRDYATVIKVDDEGEALQSAHRLVNCSVSEVEKSWRETVATHVAEEPETV